MGHRFRLAVVLLAVSGIMMPVSPATADTCVGNPNLDVMAYDINAFSTGVQGKPHQWIGTWIAESTLLVRSVFVSPDVSGANFVEFGWVREKDDTNLEIFMAWGVNGQYDDARNLGTLSVGAHLERVVNPDPTFTSWDGYIGTSLYQSAVVNFSGGFAATLTERHSPCEDNHARWDLLQYRDDNGTWDGWDEMNNINGDAGYECRKGTSDVEHFVRKISETDGPENPCVPDLDPL